MRLIELAIHNRWIVVVTLLKTDKKLYTYEALAAAEVHGLHALGKVQMGDVTCGGYRHR